MVAQYIRQRNQRGDCVPRDICCMTKECVMNERIRELAEQAGFTANDEQKVFLKVYEQELEKFAELIVKECIDQLNIPNVPSPVSAGLNLGKVAIKDHFGVEE